MYDGLDKVPIRNMNFNQLRERVAQLQDLYEVLVRRNPSLSSIYSTGSGGESGESEEFEIDWANIYTPLLRAFVNKFSVTAVPDYNESCLLDEGKTPYDLGKDADTSLIYVGTDEEGNEIYWYYNGNEWKATDNKNIYSVFEQGPAGFRLKGTLELQTDTGGRATISDSFVKMYPEGSSDPKIQIGYNPKKGENNCPVILLGAGGTTTEKDEDGNDVLLTRKIGGYEVRNEQGIIIKTARSLIIGMVSTFGFIWSFEIRGSELDEERNNTYDNDVKTGAGYIDEKKDNPGFYVKYVSRDLDGNFFQEEKKVF